MPFLECDSLDRGAHRSGGNVYSPLSVYYRVHYQPLPPTGDLGREVLACILAPRLPPGATQTRPIRTRDAPGALCLLGGKIFFLFGCGSFLNSLLNLLQYYFCFMFWSFGYKACEIAHQRSTPHPLCWKRKSQPLDHRGRPTPAAAAATAIIYPNVSFGGLD